MPSSTVAAETRRPVGRHGDDHLARRIPERRDPGRDGQCGRAPRGHRRLQRCLGEHGGVEAFPRHGEGAPERFRGVVDEHERERVGLRLDSLPRGGPRLRGRAGLQCCQAWGVSWCPDRAGGPSSPVRAWRCRPWPSGGPASAGRTDRVVRRAPPRSGWTRRAAPGSRTRRRNAACTGRNRCSPYGSTRPRRAWCRTVRRSDAGNRRTNTGSPVSRGGWGRARRARAAAGRGSRRRPSPRRPIDRTTPVHRAPRVLVVAVPQHEGRMAAEPGHVLAGLVLDLGPRRQVLTVGGAGEQEVLPHQQALLVGQVVQVVGLVDASAHTRNRLMLASTASVTRRA